MASDTSSSTEAEAPAVPGGWRRWLAALPLRGKFGRGVFWNLGSLGILGLSGIAINVLIGRYYGSEALGVFNQVFAFYILTSQVAAWGVHASALKHVAQYSEDTDECSRLISAGLTLVATFSVVACSIMFAMRGPIGAVLHSPGVTTGIAYATPAVACFAMNKVLLGVLNGYRRMKAYAFYQSLRYLLILAFLVVAILTRLRAEALAGVLSGAEIILLICLLAHTSRHFRWVAPARWAGWLRAHAAFGSKAVLGGAMGELNTRVDVLMLGYFATDSVVGIYSFAAILAEGFYQIPLVLQRNINPILTKLVTGGRVEELQGVIRRGVWLTYPVVAALAMAAIGVYPVAAGVFVGNTEFLQGWPVFAILMGGIVLVAGYIPFRHLLVQSGHPAADTAVIAMSIGSNAVLNALLIPMWGMKGAAIATGTSYLLNVMYLKGLVRWKLGIRI